MKLDTFDLMVARLYPSGFPLRDEWETARGRFSDTLMHYEILKVIALREHRRSIVDKRNRAITH